MGRGVGCEGIDSMCLYSIQFGGLPFIDLENKKNENTHPKLNVQLQIYSLNINFLNKL